jgi:general secretion pathway protein E
VTLLDKLFGRAENGDAEDEDFVITPVRSATFDATSRFQNFDFDPDQPIIRLLGDFPTWSDVLSGSTAEAGLYVPIGLADKVLAVKLSGSQIQIAYDPEFHAQVKSYIVAMRSELLSKNLQVLPKSLLAVTSILAQIKKAADAKRHGQTNASISKSDSVQQFKRWIEHARNVGATDLHMRILGGGRGEVMVRVDGELEHLKETKEGVTDRDVRFAMTAAYESLADRNSNSDGTFSEGKSMSCMIDSALGMANLRLRFASQRGIFGPKAVIRLLPSEINAKPMSFESIGFEPSHIQQLKQAQEAASGMILLCGSTGSGKTTVAKTFLETHPQNGAIAMYQVADPIEYMVSGVHQIYVQRDLVTLAEEGRKDPYSEVIESLMRMDPDFLDVGEIRDVISAGAAASVAKSGHLSLGTLHAQGIVGIATRLTDRKMGLSRSDITSSEILTLLVYQSLVPLVCTYCGLSHEHMATQPEFQLAGMESLVNRLIRMGVTPKKLRFKNPNGCAFCNYRGTKGQTVIAEMLTPDDEWLDHSSLGNDRLAWRSYRQRHSDGDLLSGDMTGKNAQEHAIFKVANALIDPRQILRFGHFDDAVGVS